MSVELDRGDLKRRLFPFLCWIGELKKPEILRADLIAGLTVALVLVPQSMAYAQLAGLPPYYGLYAAFLPGIVAALFGSSRQLATGPVAVVSLLTASALEPIAGANPELYIAYAVMLALMVGIFQIGLGLLRLGVLVNFLSHPVVTGFTNAAAIIIGTSQLGKLFGVSVEKADHTYETVFNTLIEAFNSTHMETMLMAIVALSIMIVMKRLIPKAPNVLAAVVVTTGASWLIGFEQMGGAVVGKIPEGLPPLAIPTLDFQTMGQLLSVTVAIALIGFMEAISIAKAMAASTRQRLDANQELVGQGLGNIFSSLSQGYAVSGSFSRSAVNFGVGAKTGFSAVVTGVIVGITLLWLTPLLYHLPQATLAAVIIMAVINLVKIEPIKHAWKVQRHDAAVALITFILTIIWAPHLDKGIMVGVLLSLALFLYRSMAPRIAVLSRDPDGTLRDAEVRKLETCRNISLIRFDGSLYFANTGYFEDKILERVALKPDLQFVIIDAEGINSIDSTGEEMLGMLTERLHEAGVELLFARAKKQLWDTFERTGLMDKLGREHVFALRTQAFNYAWDQLGDNHAETCPLRVPQPLAAEA
ncbi:MAG: sulfate permease [Gammaproteobacteria bacterium]|nr:sulfate permease [Gammaproteobacteria bacterium]